MAFVLSTSLAFRDPSFWGAKRTQMLQVSPPGNGPRQVEAPTKKSPAVAPLKLSPTISRSAAPELVTVTSWGGLTVPCGWSLNSSPFGATPPNGRVSSAGIGLTWPLTLSPSRRRRRWT